MGVRRHLDAMAVDGLVVSSDKAPYGPSAPRGKGRPAKVYSLTESGRDALAGPADDLAAQALRFLESKAGPSAVTEFAQARAAALIDQIECCDTDEPRQRATALAQALSGGGFVTNVVDLPGGTAVQLCQHQCPVGHIAAEFPQLCEAEAEAFSQVVGRHVTRLATFAHGDGVCTTLIPVDVATPRAVRSERTSS